MTATVTWWWIRHAPVAGAEGRLNGRRDVPCDVSDTATIAALAAVLPAGAVGVTSTLIRARQTYGALCEAGAPLPPPLAEPDFAEQSFGLWEGKTWAEIARDDPAEHARFWLRPMQSAPPGGESFVDQMSRTAAAIGRHTGSCQARDIVCTAHGGSIRAAVAMALGIGPEAAMALVVDNLSLTRLTHVRQGLLRGHGGAWLVQGVNLRWPLPADA